MSDPIPASSHGADVASAAVPPTLLDLRGEVCPYTFVRTKLALEDLPEGAELEIWLDHRAAFRNVPRALREDGHSVLSVDIDGEPALCRVRVRCCASSLPR